MILLAHTLLHYSMGAQRPIMEAEQTEQKPLVPEVVKTTQMRLEDPISHLGKLQRRVAQMKAADCTVAQIALVLECSEDSVVKILREPKVQKLMLKLGAMTVDDMRPRIAEVNQSVEEHLKEAFEYEVALMRNAGNIAAEHPNEIDQARLCHTVASSLLDRGGVNKPKQLETKNTNLNIPADSLGNIVSVLKELNAI